MSLPTLTATGTTMPFQALSANPGECVSNQAQQATMTLKPVESDSDAFGYGHSTYFFFDGADFTVLVGHPVYPQHAIFAPTVQQIANSMVTVEVTDPATSQLWFQQYLTYTMEVLTIDVDDLTFRYSDTGAQSYKLSATVQTTVFEGVVLSSPEVVSFGGDDVQTNFSPVSFTPSVPNYKLSASQSTARSSVGVTGLYSINGVFWVGLTYDVLYQTRAPYGSVLTITQTKDHTGMTVIAPNTGGNQFADFDNRFFLPTPRQIIVTPEAFSLLRDKTDALWTAKPLGSDTLLYRTRSGTAARETLPTISNCKACSMWQNARGDVFVFGLKAGGDYKLWRSQKYGAVGTWTEMPTAPFSSATYTKPDGCGLASGGVAAIAIENATNKLWFRFSHDDGATWSTPVAIATLASPTQFRIRQKLDHTLVASTSDMATVYKCSKLGAPWAPVP